MTDFGLTNGYQVFDGLDQGEVFSPLLWCIFYDLLLCEVKCQGNVCGYRLNSHFVSRSGLTESQAGLSFFFATGAFVNDTIWVGGSQAATQHILNIASEFFRVNDISINNDKTVAILINCRINVPSLFISGLPISVVYRGESYQYFGIFLLTEGLSKSSLAKAHSDICFFINLVLRKVVSDKQFLYLVSAVFHLIIDALICRGLKLKAGLLLDFPSDTIHYPFFYGLKLFLQCQFESKVALLISFANSGGILGRLFGYKSHDLQILCWRPIHPLISSACICISVSNNFLAGMVHILLDCNLSLGGSLTSAFWFHDGVPMSVVLGESLFFKFLPSLWHFGIVFVDQLHNQHGVWKRLDPRGPVPDWFRPSVVFLAASHSSSTASVGAGLLNFYESNDFVNVDSLSVYTDGSLRNLGTVDCRAEIAVFFEDIDLGVGVGVQGLVSSTLAELQAIALALECISAACSVNLFLDSQAALDICKSELSLVCPDFRNQYWVKCQHIRNGHSGISENDHADTASLSGWYLPPCVDGHFLLADGGVVSGNSRHFIGFGSGFLAGSLCSDVDWLSSSRVWHPDLHMATGFTSRFTADTHTYLIKTLHYRLPVAVEVSDHVFSCVIAFWALSSLFGCVAIDKAVTVFHDPKIAGVKITDFVYSICSAFKNNIWLVRTKHHAFMEKNGLIPVDGSFVIPVSGLVSRLSAGVVKLLGITEAFGILFGFHKSCSFFSGIGDLVSVNIVV
ncbi:hypothetical protein G9A89_017783 [Geosiphon pyriformis]|nr:hypothetical protein G9A89_017783 [Geosiphon pyriformis]